MRASLIAIALMVPTAARAQPAPAPAPSPHVELEALGTASMLRVGPRGMDHDVVLLGGLGVAASYVTRARVAVVADVQLGHAEGTCVADGACWSAIYDRLVIATLGARWFYRPDAYVQLAALYGRSHETYADTYSVDYGGPGAALAAGWRWSLGPRSFVGVEARAFAWHADREGSDNPLDVVAGGAALTLGVAP